MFREGRGRELPAPINWRKDNDPIAFRDRIIELRLELSHALEATNSNTRYDETVTFLSKLLNEPSQADEYLGIPFSQFADKQTFFLVFFSTSILFYFSPEQREYLVSAIAGRAEQSDKKDEWIVETTLLDILSLEEFGNVTRSIDINSFNPLTYRIVHKLFLHLENTCKQLAGTYAFHTFLLLAQGYGLFDQPNAYAYRRIISPYIKDSDPSYIISLRVAEPEWEESRRLEKLRRHFGESTNRFETSYVGWNGISKKVSYALIHDRVSETPGLSFENEMNREYAIIAVKKQQHHAQRTTYLRSSLSILRDSDESFFPIPEKIPLKYRLEKMTTYLSLAELKEFVVFLSQYQGELRDPELQNLFSRRKKIDALWSTIGSQSQEIFKKSSENGNPLQAIRESSYSSEEKIAFLLIFLETYAAHMYEDIPLTIFNTLKQWRTSLSRIIRDTRDIPPPPPEEAAPTYNGTYLRSSTDFERIQKQASLRMTTLAGYGSELINMDDPALQKILADREEFIRLRDSLEKPARISFLLEEKKLEALAIQAAHISILLSFMMLAFSDYASYNQLKAGSLDSAQYSAFFLSTFVPAALVAMGGMYTDSKLKTTQIQSERFAFSTEGNTKNKLHNAFIERREKIKKKIRRAGTILMLTALASAGPTIKTFSDEQSLGEKIPQALQTISYTVRELVAQILPGVQIGSQAEYENSQNLPSNSIEAPRADNPRFTVETNGTTPTFFLGQVCLFTPDDLRENGCVQWDDERIPHQSVSFEDILVVTSDSEFEAQRQGFLLSSPNNLLFTNTDVSRPIAEVPVGYSLIKILVNQADGPISAEWSPFGGVHIEGKAKQITVVFTRHGSNTEVISADRLTLSNKSPFSQADLQESFLGDDRLNTLIEQARTDRENGVSLEEEHDLLKSRIAQLGIEYGFATFNPFQYSNNAQRLGGLLMQENLICNQFATAVGSIELAAGYKGIAQVKGYALPFSPPNQGTDRDGHQILIYEVQDPNTGAISYRVFDATLPSVEQLSTLEQLSPGEQIGYERSLTPQPTANATSEATSIKPTFIAPTETPFPSPTITATSIPATETMTLEPTATETATVIPTEILATEENGQPHFFVTVDDGSRSNIREEANVDAATLISVPPNTQLTLLSWKHTDTQGFIWYKVQIPGSTSSGWIRSDRGTLTDDALPTDVPTLIPTETSIPPTATATETTIPPAETPAPIETDIEVLPTTQSQSPTVTLIPPTQVESPTPETAPPASSPSPWWALPPGLAAAVAAVRKWRPRQKQTPTTRIEAEKVTQKPMQQVEAEEVLPEIQEDNPLHPERVALRREIVPIISKYFLFVFEFYKKQGDGFDWPNLMQTMSAQLSEELISGKTSEQGFVLDRGITPLPPTVQSKLIGNDSLTRGEILEMYHRQDDLSELDSISTTLSQISSIPSQEILVFQTNAYKKYTEKNLHWKKLLRESFSEQILPQSTIEELVDSIKNSYSLLTEESIAKTEEGISMLMNALSNNRSEDPRIQEALFVLSTLQNGLERI